MDGILTKGVKLKRYNSSSSATDKYEAIKGLQEFPDLGGTKDKVDVTTLDHSSYHYIPGIEDYGDLAFKFIYDTDVYEAVAGYGEDLQQFCVEFPDGIKMYFDGYADVTLNGAGVNDALTFTLNIFLQSDITDTEPSHS